MTPLGYYGGVLVSMVTKSREIMPIRNNSRSHSGICYLNFPPLFYKHGRIDKNYSNFPVENRPQSLMR